MLHLLSAFVTAALSYGQIKTDTSSSCAIYVFNVVLVSKGGI